MFLRDVRCLSAEAPTYVPTDRAVRTFHGAKSSKTMSLPELLCVLRLLTAVSMRWRAGYQECAARLSAASNSDPASCEATWNLAWVQKRSGVSPTHGMYLVTPIEELTSRTASFESSFHEGLSCQQTADIS